jgi:hypothetical protein
MDPDVVVIRGRPIGAALVHAMAHPLNAAPNNAPASVEHIHTWLRPKIVQKVELGELATLDGLAAL